MFWAELQRGKNLYISDCHLLLAMPKNDISFRRTTQKKKLETQSGVKVNVKKMKKNIQIWQNSRAILFLLWPHRVSSLSHILLFAGYMQYFLSSPPPCGPDFLRIHAVVKDISGL